ncbi:hypothetical protein INS49_000062 [Diaporthe citri]|uniref:uncharacterized protein n=1 Tax=Diaporthe citri TaxID=83186 RepID=UPI001C82532D|nr:uncharacterized protein INS49_000062 [Diaporthe citri]KAG6365886.1 hypothetical protein INS49_000062 [Diaporthe citri]
MEITRGSPTDRHELQRQDAVSFVHPGALHTIKDFERVQQHVRAKEQPWYRAWQHLESTKLAQTTWAPTPQEILVRGANDALPQNYGYAYRDAHSAYQLALRWLIGGNTSYADHAAKILDGWGSTLVDIDGNEDKYLAAGLYGDFLDHHNDKQDFYYANWDLCNIASLMAIAIFNDNKTMYDYAVNYFKDGLPGQPEVVANGGSAGVDLYSIYGHRILNAAEYVAKYNTNHTVPYTPYRSWEGVLEVVSEKARFDIRPGYEALHAHYNAIKGLNASWSLEYRDFVNANLTGRIEGGGGDYSPNSGGNDALGHCTLMYRLKDD